MFRLLQLAHPGLTMASVTRQGPSGGQHPAAAPETASPWNVKDILQESMPTIEQATRDVVSYLDTAPQTLHAALRTLQVGCDCTFRISGVEQPAANARRYHGTSWLGFKGILKRGFLPVYGAGRSYQWRRHNTIGPLVYTSHDKTVPTGIQWPWWTTIKIHAARSSLVTQSS